MNCNCNCNCKRRIATPLRYARSVVTRYSASRYAPLLGAPRNSATLGRVSTRRVKNTGGELRGRRECEGGGRKRGVRIAVQGVTLESPPLLIGSQILASRPTLAHSATSVLLEGTFSGLNLAEAKLVGSTKQKPTKQGRERGDEVGDMAFDHKPRSGDSPKRGQGFPVSGNQGGGQTLEVRVHRRHPGQEVIHSHPARFKVVMCGRRFGKTALGVREVCDAALSGQPVGWFSPNYKYALEVWRELLGRLKPVIERSNDQERRIELIGGGIIEVWTMDSPDPGLGRKYKLVVIDEAGIVPDLLMIWQQALRPTLVDLGGRALFLGTPRGRRHGFVQLFARGERADEPDWQSFRARTLDNPYIPPEEVESARRELPPEVFAQEFEGIPTDDGANPFGLDAIRHATQPVPKGDPVVWGADLARSMDYTVLIGLDAWRRVVRLERWQAPWAITKARIKGLVGDVPVVADATGVGDAIVSDLQQMGCSVTPHVFTQPSKLRLMQRLIAAFQGNELALPDTQEATWLTQELNAFEFTYTATGVRYEAPRGEHDDGVMALGLALYGWDRVQGVVPEAPPPVAEVVDDPQIARMRANEAAGMVMLGGISTPIAPEPQAAYEHAPTDRQDWMFGFV